jgi:hypothetical protein
MIFDKLYELCIKKNEGILESFISFDNLYSLCLEKKEEVDFSLLKKERDDILKEYDDKVISLKEEAKKKIVLSNLLEKEPEKYSNEYDGFFNLKSDSNEVSFYKKKNVGNWEIESKDGKRETAMSEEESSDIAYTMLEKPNEDLKKEFKKKLIEKIKIPKKMELKKVYEDDEGLVHYDIQKIDKEKEKINAGIADINHLRQFDVFVVVRDANNLSEINNAIGELEKKIQNLEEKKNLFERKIEADFVHSVGSNPPQNIPQRGYYKVATKPTDDNRVLEYEVDPQTTNMPDVGRIEDLDGQQVGMLEADRHNTRGSNMGGPLHPFLISNQAVATLPDGRSFKPVWANMNSAFVTRAKNIIKNTTSGYALIQIMKEEAHKSNRKFVQDVMGEIDSIKSSIKPNRLDALHVILEVGAKNPNKFLTQYNALVKLLEDDIISQEDFDEIVAYDDIKKNIIKYKPMMDFLKPLGTIKSYATRGDIASSNKLFDQHVSKYRNQKWYKNIVNKYKNKTFVEEASRFTFNQRGSAMDRIDGIAFIPSVSEKLMESMDFNNGLNLDIVAAVQLSKDMDAFAIYTGNDSRQEAKMSKNERYLRDQFLKNKQFKIHPSYDWMMLGPKDGRSFVLETPIDAVKLFPDYAANHPKKSVREGSKETIVGTMKKSKIPLIIKIKK